MDMSAINWLAVIAAVVVGFPLGFIWYGPLFKERWMAAVGLSEEKIEQESNMAKIFGLSALFQFIMATCLALFFFGDPAAADAITASTGALYGFLTGFAWVAMAIGVNALFEQRSFQYTAIVGGYWVVTFTLMGLVLGAWR